MWSLFLALTWTAVAAGPLFQTATSENVLQKRELELQEATPESVLHQNSDGLNVDQYLQTYGYMNDINERSQDYDQRRTDAIKSFQIFAGLQVTGEENEETHQQMLRPRCGMKDIELERPSNYKWNVKNVTFRFKNFSPDLDKGSIVAAVTESLNQWAVPAKLTYTKIEWGTPLMEIRFVSRAHSPCPYAMDGPGGVLAHAYPPVRHPLGGDIHFDDDETYKYKEGRGLEILSVSLHEAGHTLGLGHDNTKGSIMTPWYNGQTTLGPSDIERATKLYA